MNDSPPPQTAQARDLFPFTSVPLKNPRPSLCTLVSLSLQDDQVVLQCTASILKEQIKLCLSCEGFGNRLCFLETTSNAQVVNRLSVPSSSISLRVFTVAQGSLVSRVSEHPSGPRYMLLHFGTVPLCAGVTGNALQLFR